MLSVQVSGDTELIERIGKMPSGVHNALLRKITALAIEMQRKIRVDKLSGQVLNKRTGALQSSIFQEVSDERTAIIATVSAGKDVPYAAIHEYGGVTKPHDIYPKNAKALHFFIGGKEVFAKVVHHPGSKMPERSYMRSTLADMKQEIIDGMTDAVRQGANGK